VAVVRFPSGLLPCVVVAVVASWFGVVHRGITRRIGISVAVLALLGALALLFRNDGWPYLVWLVVGVVIWHTASRMAFRVHVRRPAAEPPRRAVLFINPWSGDGKAAKVGLAEEGAKRGIRTVELHRGDDLERLVHDAVSTGRTRSRRRVGTVLRRSAVGVPRRRDPRAAATILVCAGKIGVAVVPARAGGDGQHQLGGLLRQWSPVDRHGKGTNGQVRQEDDQVREVTEGPEAAG
jgi:hypothetical protein